jgi:hypothetical protein
MEKCWARHLGTCGEGISREHVISASLFKGHSVTIRGDKVFPNPTTFSVKKLVAKVLCKRHNESLSPVDGRFAGIANDWDAAIVNALGGRKLELLARATIPRDDRGDNTSIIHRWLLKTSLNVFCGFLKDGPDGMPYRPPARIVEMAMGFTAIGPPISIFPVMPQTRANFGDSFDLSVLTYDDVGFDGMLIRVRNIWQAVSFVERPLPSLLGPDKRDWAGARVLDRSQVLFSLCGPNRSLLGNKPLRDA